MKQNIIQLELSLDGNPRLQMKALPPVSVSWFQKMRQKVEQARANRLKPDSIPRQIYMPLSEKMIRGYYA